MHTPLYVSWPACRRLLRHAVLVGLAAACLPALAQSHSPTTLPYAGAWEGQVGGSPVRVCFTSPQDGQYFYTRRLHGIRLEADPQAPVGAVWLEQVTKPGSGSPEHTGTWTLKPLAATPATSGLGQLEGSWSAPQGGKPLPIQLRKLADLPAPKVGGRDCPAEYYRPIEDALKVAATDARFQGQAYRKLSSPVGNTLELPEGLPGAAIFNAQARQWLKDQAVNAYECTMGGGEPWHRDAKPLLWTRELLVVEDDLGDTYCGGAHGSSDLVVRTYEVPSGKELDTWSWLLAGRAGTEAPGAGGKKPALRALLEKRPPSQDACGDAADWWGTLAPYPSKAGLVFHTLYPHVARACEDDITLGWRALAPHLTPAGKAVAAQFAAP